MCLSMEVVPERKTVKPSRVSPGSALGAASNVWAAAERSESRHIEEARQARHWVDRIESDGPPEPPWRREIAGCSIIGSPESVVNAEAEKLRKREAETSSRANETRVLEIEAVDGRNRSHASRVWSASRRKAIHVFYTLVTGLRDNPPDADHGQILR